MLTLVQGLGPDGRLSVLACRDGVATTVPGANGIVELATRAVERSTTLVALLDESGPGEPVDLAEELANGRLVSPLAGVEPRRILVSGTGLTHLASAQGRDQMHAGAAETQTDSMRMFLDGQAGGKPAPGHLGHQPEWFYKGDGSQLVGPGADLARPAFAWDGGDEAELAGIYLIGDDGVPYRLGFCLGNEFSDHRMEKQNYLWLAHSKLRPAALGAELLVGDLPAAVRGRSRILRSGATVWERAFASGEEHMTHSIANLEHHHFKYPQFRRPGDVHVHFFGAAALSFGDGVEARDGDVFEIEAEPFQLPLRNRLAFHPEETVIRATL